MNLDLDDMYGEIGSPAKVGSNSDGASSISSASVVMKSSVFRTENVDDSVKETVTMPTAIASSLSSLFIDSMNKDIASPLTGEDDAEI